MKKALIAMACVVGAIAVGLLVFMGLSIGGVLPQGGFQFFQGRAELANRQTFAATQYNTIDVGYGSERITLHTAPGSDIVLEEYFSSWDEEMLASVATSGDTLTIRAGARGFMRGLFFWRAEIKLYLPAGWQGNLVVENSSGSIASEADFELASLKAGTTSGSIHLDEIETAGDITLKSSSGSVNCERLIAGGDMHLSATSGSVRPGDVTAGGNIVASTSSGSIRFGSVAGVLVQADASSGSISFERLDGEFALKNSSGGIRVEDGNAFGNASCSSGSLKLILGRLDGDITMKTSSGSCRLTLPANSAFQFSAQTGSGSIKTPDDGALSYNQKGNQASGSFGSNPQHKVHMEASSGSVRLEWD